MDEPIRLDESEPPTLADRATAFVRETAPEHLPEDAELQGWVLISAWRSPEASFVSARTNLPGWMCDGLVEYAKREQLYAGADWYPEDDEDCD